MARHKAPAKGKRLVWRMSDRAPLGEWVDPDLPPAPEKPDKPAEPEDKLDGRNWRRSSYDLLTGMEVDDSPNTVPDDLFDELFGPPKDEPPKKPGP